MHRFWFGVEASKCVSLSATQPSLSSLGFCHSQDTPVVRGEMPGVTEHTLVLQRPALNILFKELCRIRDQLSETTGVTQ
jgi:hypothetical protein